MIRSLVPLAALLMSPFLLAQDVDGKADSGLSSPAGPVSAAEPAPLDGRQEKPAGEGFSPVAEAPGDPALAIGASFADYIPAGTCLVVDQLLQEYCLQDPDDLSCQLR